MKTTSRKAPLGIKRGSLSFRDASKAARVAKAGRSHSNKVSGSTDTANWERYLGHFGAPERSKVKTSVGRKKSTSKRGGAKRGGAKKR